MRFFKKNLFLCLTVLFLAAMLCPTRTLAASRPSRITKCQLVSAKKVRVMASLPDTSAVSSSKCYLFALSFSDSGLPVKARPLATAKTSKKMSFTVGLHSTKTSSLLYSRFVVASRKKNGSYTIISDSRYISNPEKAARYTYRFPTAPSKKGLQSNLDMPEDAIDLNIRHSALNIVFSDLISSSEEHNRQASISYQYHGRTYWFRRGVVSEYDAQLTALKENNVVVSAILLLGWRSDLKSLICPGGQKKGHSFYAWNTSDPAAREQLQAALSFLGSRYGTSQAEHGRIVNWIVGNEVNNYNLYNYAGRKTLNQYALIYANMFRMVYNTMTSIYANARVYIPLDHLWNTRVSGSFTAREMLDAFASALEKKGGIRWNLAFHPYSSPLTEPKFWQNTNRQLTLALTSPVINMGNIGVLTAYIRQKYGPGTRIILSEQGYTSVRHLKSSLGELKIDAQKEQAAAIAYSYYLTEADDMIDSFIMNRQVDHQAEVDQGLDLGLWTTDSSDQRPEWADTKKQSWETFKYMDSDRAQSVTADVLPIIGIRQWSDVIPGYDQLLYNKSSYASARLEQVKSYPESIPIASRWMPYGASLRIVRGKTAGRVIHDQSRNRNSLWGFSQTFSGGLSFASAPHFCTTLCVQNTGEAKAQISIRFYSGNHILESSLMVDCNKTVRLRVSLENWSCLNAVDKIRILVSPTGKEWSDSASLKMVWPVQG